MQPVTSLYKPYESIRKIEPSLDFELIDIDAGNVVSVTASPGTWFSKPEQTYDKINTMEAAIATCEPNEVKLDGRYVSLKETGNGEVGYWSEVMSDENGLIDVELQFDFSGNHDSKAFTVIFDDKTNNVAENFTISAYNGAELVGEKEITGNQNAFIVVELPTFSYNLIILHITKTNKPKRHVRVCELVFGYLQIFSGDKIKEMSVRYEGSLYCDNLPSNMLTVTIDNTDKEYNIQNPTGIYKFLQNGQGINSYVTISGEKIKLGRFYFDSATSDDNSMTAKITGYDRMMILDGIQCNIGETGTWTVAEAVPAVLAESGYTIGVDIPAGIEARTIGKAIAQGTSCREALRQIAQAAKCVCAFNRSDILQFFDPLEERQDNYIYDHLTMDNMSSRPSVSDDGYINYVEISVEDDYAETKTTYTAGEEGNEKQSISIQNPLVLDKSVAEWVLEMLKYRTEYTVKEQGNPARELYDDVKIDTIFELEKVAKIAKETFSISTGLSGSLTLYSKQE